MFLFVLGMFSEIIVHYFFNRKSFFFFWKA